MVHAKEIAKYEKDGFAVIRGSLSTHDICRSLEEIDRLCGLKLVEPSNLRTPHLICLDGASRMEKIDPVIDLSVLFSELAQSERLLSFPRQLFSSDAVSLFRDKLIIRPTGSMGYAAHQDYSWWHPYNPNQYVTLGGMPVRLYP